MKTQTLWIQIAICAITIAWAVAPAIAQTTVSRSASGNAPRGQAVEMFTLKSPHVEVQLITYGARLVSIRTPDRAGKMADVILSFPSLADYIADRKTYSGSTVGRYANRIVKGQFTLDGHQYQIPTNNNGNAIHGGPEGFDRKVWNAKAVPNGVEFSVTSPDGDQGFPGTLLVTVRFTLDDKALHIDYSARTNRETIVNLTNHTYFNLHGDDRGTILDHVLTINADRYTPEVAGLVPTGEIATVYGTPLDFRKPAMIGSRIHEPNEQLKIGGGYDNNWVLNGRTGILHLAATLKDPLSGRTLTITTTEPGLEFYTGNGLDGSIVGRHGIPFTRYKALCLETEHYADSPNHPNFPSTVLKPGQTMHSTTILTFGAD